MTIFARIFLSTAAIVAAALMYFVSLEEDATTKQYREATEEPLVDEAYLLAAIVAEQMGRTTDGPPSFQNFLLARFGPWEKHLKRCAPR
jgi:hypothetical protein